MALEDLNPAVRVEEILDGADIEPATRLEYFMKKAANEVPKPAGSSDAGKVVTVNEDGDGFELTEPGTGLPEIAGVSDAGKVVSVNEDGNAYELATPGKDVVVITLPAELNTLLMSALQSRAPAAIAAGHGKPVYNSGTAEIATDTASLATLFNNIADARDSGNVMILSGGTLVTESTSNRSDKLAGITFVYEIYPYTIYTFRILISILVDAAHNYYFITSVITLLDTQGGN